MIRVNLLPPEHRPSTGTPVGRFVAIVAGVVLVVGSGCFYAYTHFVQLSKVREVRSLREEEATNKERQKERSLALQKEIDEYQQRRRAIQTINRNRILWSRKLDQFFDIVSTRDAPYTGWLQELEIPTQLASNRRTGPANAVPDGGQFRFTGYLAMQTPNEAPAQNSAFYKSLTGDPEATGRPSEFFSDFVAISNPMIDIVERSENKNLSPPITGAYKYELRLKPPVVDTTGNKSPAAKK
jgi:cell division protein FtsB